MYIIEVSPAAWLISEEVHHHNYKKDAIIRRVIVEDLKAKVTMGAIDQQKLIDSEHVLDAFLCCLCGIDFIENRCITPKHLGIEQSIVLKEGWIWIKEAPNTTIRKVFQSL